MTAIMADNGSAAQSLFGLFIILAFLSVPVMLAWFVHRKWGQQMMVRKMDRETEAQMNLGIAKERSIERVRRRMLEENGY